MGVFFADDGTHPASAAEERVYQAAIRARGGPRSPGGRAYIDEQHRLFKASQDAHIKANVARGEGCLSVFAVAGGLVAALAGAVATARGWTA